MILRIRGPSSQFPACPAYQRFSNGKNFATRQKLRDQQSRPRPTFQGGHPVGTTPPPRLTTPLGVDPPLTPPTWPHVGPYRVHGRKWPWCRSARLSRRGLPEASSKGGLHEEPLREFLASVLPSCPVGWEGRKNALQANPCRPSGRADAGGADHTHRLKTGATDRIRMKHGSRPRQNDGPKVRNPRRRTPPATQVTKPITPLPADHQADPMLAGHAAGVTEIRPFHGPAGRLVPATC